MAKFHCGVAPLKIETGRYEGLFENDRICSLCEAGEVESEVHTLIRCPLYDIHRHELFEYISIIAPDFNQLSDIDKFVFIMSNSLVSKVCAKTCHVILNERRKALYC